MTSLSAAEVRSKPRPGLLRGAAWASPQARTACRPKPPRRAPMSRLGARSAVAAPLAVSVAALVGVASAAEGERGLAAGPQVAAGRSARSAVNQQRAQQIRVLSRAAPRVAPAEASRYWRECGSRPM